MQFDDYQRDTRVSAVYPDIGNNFIFPTLGLVGEAGEVAEKIKKLGAKAGKQLDERLIVDEEE